MAVSRVPLYALLDVLDRVDSYQQAEPQEQERLLLAAAQTAEPGLSKVILSRAVADHLSQATDCKPSQAPFAFGWRRPQTHEARTQMHKRYRYQWMRWFGETSEDRAPIFVLSMMVLGSIVGWGGASILGGGQASGALFGATAACLAAICLGTLFFPDLELPTEEVEVGEDRLKTYLKSPRAIRYLEAMLSSPVPLVLARDRQQLDQLAYQDKKSRERTAAPEVKSTSSSRLAQDRIAIRQALSRQTESTTA